MQLGLSENLSALVARRFAAAKDGGSLIFSSTHVSIITTGGIPYQLRYCPALAMKPKDLKKTPSSGPKPPKIDPFENPSPELLLASFPPRSPTHALVLNKFPVIPNHFILATKDWKAQTDLLETADLEATYECLRAWGDQPSSTTPSSSTTNTNRLFAFFNSGEDSGASQPHRHIQFLPVEAMHQPGTESWSPLIDLVTAQPQSNPSTFQSHPSVPFAHFALPLPSNSSPETLHAIYTALYRTAVAAVQGRDSRDGVQSIPTHGPSAISYNLAMTLQTMMIAPRVAESARVPVDAAVEGDIVDHGIVSLNGTILAGTLMVKAQGEWDVLRAKPEALGRLLKDVGVSEVEMGHALL
ncbi:Diadenosine 5',5'''-P1,P4-tetraphosphate phosphorylase 2 [Penicillium rolfsii]|nr:Diadenosine 5',5'''-P1,P4-tetraphosphate phosphorylase 2 [Penicillium rolfsii]